MPRESAEMTSNEPKPSCPQVGYPGPMVDPTAMRIFGKGLGDPCVVFLRRPHWMKSWVEIDRDRSTAEILRHWPSGWTDLLHRLAAPSRSASPGRCVTRQFRSTDLSNPLGGSRSSVWHDPRPGTSSMTDLRIRLRHKVIRRDATLAVRSRRHQNVTGFLAQGVAPRGSVLIRFDPGLTRLCIFYVSSGPTETGPDLEEAPSETSRSACQHFAGAGVRRRMAVPALLPVCAACW
jgi:hypothetical protein